MSIYLCQSISVQNFQCIVVHWGHAKAFPLILFIPNSFPSFLLQKIHSTDQTQLWKENRKQNWQNPMKRPWKWNENADEETHTEVEYCIRCVIIRLCYVWLAGQANIWIYLSQTLFSLVAWCKTRQCGCFKRQSRNFPGGPVVKNPPCSAGDAALMPGPGTKTPHAAEQLS